MDGDATRIVAWSGPGAHGTQSKIVVPVLDESGVVRGLLDVESDPPDALSPEDREHLEACARLLPPLWS